MEKKSLGRGLEEISSVFLPNAERTQAGGFSAEKLRHEQCTSCINFLDGPLDQPRCSIPTLANNGSCGLRYDAERHNRGGYCHYFEHISPDKASGPENVPAQDDLSNEPEIEETVTVRRRIAFPLSPEVQENLRKTLFDHLKEGFVIKSIELTRVKQGSKERKISRREDVAIVVKDSPCY